MDTRSKSSFFLTSDNAATCSVSAVEHHTVLNCLGHPFLSLLICRSELDNIVVLGFDLRIRDATNSPRLHCSSMLGLQLSNGRVTIFNIFLTTSNALSSSAFVLLSSSCSDWRFSGSEFTSSVVQLDDGLAARLRTPISIPTDNATLSFQRGCFCACDQQVRLKIL